ncbi:N-terminal C2 in EEIG1 and EHBP1 proteins-domain-containing protein [Trametes polyzona]|nr:N-terminal C2 in EEIG1 and EHBP1 proteins-domain-containing protein [Trametes polyzona]
MKQLSTTSGSTSSGASSAPAPPSHGLRSQLGHLLPKHALFQVHLHIEQLSNVPLMTGEFAVRWKFKNVQSGSGLLSKMKGSRSWSGQSKGRSEPDAAAGGAVGAGEYGERYVEDDTDGHSTHDGFDDASHHEDAPRSPLEHDHPPAFEPSHPPTTPTPIINGHTASSTSLTSRSEARGMTPWAKLQSYNVKWDHSVNVVVQMDVHRETSDLLPNELKLVVMQGRGYADGEDVIGGSDHVLPITISSHARRRAIPSGPCRVIPGDPDSPQQPRIGAVYLNLAEYADAGKITRRYLLRQSKTNATLKLSIELEHIGGEKHYKPPPLRKGEILASVSGILNNNGLFNTRFARELDLYVGSDRIEDDGSFPYADKDGHIQPDELANSYGLRATEHLIEALFNPLPSNSTDPSPFTYYAPPHPDPPRRQDSVADSLDSSGGRRSVDSSVGSASYVATTSEHSSSTGFEHASGVTSTATAGTDSHRHWWQKIRSRPTTPARTAFRPTTPAPPMPVRQG